MAKFIVEIRTSIYEVRYHEIRKTLPSLMGRVTLNNLSQLERESFRRLCSGAGLPIWSRSDHPRELRDLLLEMFGNELIRKNIENTLNQIFSSHSRRRILVMTMLVATYHERIEPAFVRSVSGYDPFSEFKPVEDIAREVFDFSTDEFKARSAVFSEFVVEAFIEADEIANCVVDVVLHCARRKDIRSNRILMSNMMAYAGLLKILKKQSDPVGLIINIYERLRYDERINSEPLFWLQYAIAMAARPKLQAAAEYIRNAYEQAKLRSGFETYQIDTQAFRINIMRATEESSGVNIGLFHEILDGLETMNSMLGEDSHRSYAIKVLEEIPAFVGVRLGDMGPPERSAMVFWLNKVSASLAALPIAFKTGSGSEEVRRKLQRAIRTISS